MTEKEDFLGSYGIEEFDDKRTWISGGNEAHCIPDSEITMCKTVINNQSTSEQDEIAVEKYMDKIGCSYFEARVRLGMIAINKTK